jgi:hypothetical protein
MCKLKKYFPRKSRPGKSIGSNTRVSKLPFNVIEKNSTPLAIHYYHDRKTEFSLYETAFVVRVDYHNNGKIEKRLKPIDYFNFYYDRNRAQDGFAIVNYEVWDKVQDYLGKTRGSPTP